MKAIKFVKWDIDPLESLKDSNIYVALEEADKGNLAPLKKMYNWYNRDLLKGFYKLQGWQFILDHKYLKTYLVKEKYNNHFNRYVAPNKTCLYEALGGRHNVEDIYEVIDKGICSK